MQVCEGLIDTDRQKGWPKSNTVIPFHSPLSRPLFLLFFALSFFFFLILAILIFLFHLHSCFDLGMVLLWQLGDGDDPLKSHYEGIWTFYRNKLNLKHHSCESEETMRNYLVLGRDWVGRNDNVGKVSNEHFWKSSPSWGKQRLLSPELAYEL